MNSAHRLATAIVLFFVVSILSPTLHAATVKIRTAYPDHEGVSKVLVIVRSIEGQRVEFARELSGPEGWIPSLELPAGVYEAIATCPYGYLPTTVFDFSVGDEPATMEIPLRLPATDQTVNLNQMDWHVRVIGDDGQPALNVVVIGRNEDASTGVSVARTDARGLATISVPVDGALIEVISGKQSWSGPAYHLSNRIFDCRMRCLMQSERTLQKLRQPLTIRLHK